MSNKSKNVAIIMIYYIKTYVNMVFLKLSYCTVLTLLVIIGDDKMSV